MSQLRLLAISLFASSFVLSAAAQSAAPNRAPLAATIPSPQILPLEAPPAPSGTPARLPPGSYTLTASQDAPTFKVPAGKPVNLSREGETYLQLHKEESVLAQNQSPCLTLRAYNFTTRNLKSAHPRASSETDCTPASRGHILLVAPVPSRLK